MGAFRDLTHQRFGRLIALYSNKRNKYKKAIWTCKCDCGNFKDVLSEQLINNITKSCGCLHIESARERIKKVHEGNVSIDAPFNRIWSSYIVHAKKRNLSFILTKPEFKQLITKKCYFCDSVNSNCMSSQAGMTMEYNGVDRLDNSKGYILTNCVSCCRICNKMKCNMSVKDFLEHINKIYDKNNKK